MAWYPEGFDLGFECRPYEYYDKRVEEINNFINNTDVPTKIKLLRDLSKREDKNLKSIRIAFDKLSDLESKNEFWQLINNQVGSVKNYIDSKLKILTDGDKKGVQFDISQLVLISEYIFTNIILDLTTDKRADLLSSLSGFGKDNIVKAYVRLNQIRNAKGDKPTKKEIENYKTIKDLIKKLSLDNLVERINEDLEEIEKK
jgi:hypothetical protein